MSALTVRLPESSHKGIKVFAKREGYSINQFSATAAAEKMSVLLTLDYLREEGAQGKREDFQKFLNRLPAGVPLSTDTI